MVALLEAMRDRGIVALPMHDGIMVQRSRASESEKLMRDVSKAKLGAELPVKRKAVKGLD